MQTLCSNYNCKRRANCLRYKLQPESNQNYTKFSTGSSEDCRYFIGILGWQNSQMSYVADADKRNKRNN